jgi:hypothetical protein
VPKFSVAITGVDVTLEDDHATMEQLKRLGMGILKEAYKLERQTMILARSGNMPAAGFQVEKNTEKPVRPIGMITLNPEIKYE